MCGDHTDSFVRVQIASALSRPEDSAATGRTADAAAAISEAAPEAESMLTPEEALHSIHEEPEEGTSARGVTHSVQQSGNPSATAYPAGYDASRGSSFVQAAGSTDRHTTQNILLPGEAHPGKLLCQDGTLCFHAAVLPSIASSCLSSGTPAMPCPDEASAADVKQRGSDTFLNVAGLSSVASLSSLRAAALSHSLRTRTLHSMLVKATLP